MKTNEWFICLTYDKINFLLPHSYYVESNVEPEVFIDFDTMVYGFFSASNSVKHPAALTVKCGKIAMLSTSSIPTVVSVDLSSFHSPSGVLEKGAKETGIIAMSFMHDKENNRLSIIVNPELLYEKWSKR